MPALRDPREFGRLVGAARGYAGWKKPEFGKKMGRSVPTVTRWERGEVGSIGATTAERQQLAERVVEITGCPPEWFGLGEASPELEQRVAALEAAVLPLRQALLSQPDSEEAEEILQVADDAFQQIERSVPPVESPGAGTGSG